MPRYRPHMMLLAIVHILLGSGYYTAVAKVPKFFTEQRCGDAPGAGRRLRPARGIESDRPHSLGERRLAAAELTPAWDGLIAAKRGGAARSFSHAKSRSVRVLGSRRVDGALWFRVHLLSNDECRGHEPRELASGWIRAYSSKREPTLRHISRGC